jgi:hypothetical protein
MHSHIMRRFGNCRLARMSSGQYCLIRDLGLVKGGKGLRHHEVVLQLSARGIFQFVKRLAVQQISKDEGGVAARLVAKRR